MELVPGFWTFTLRTLFGVADDQLIQQLWAVYPKSAALRFHLHRCGTPATALEVTKQRVRHMGRLLEPNVLLGTCEKLAPRGRQRPKALTDLQERILGLLDHEEHWKWHE